MTELLYVIKEMLMSKKFLSALAGVISAAVGRLGLDLASDDLLTILAPLMAYIVGQGLSDQGKEAEKIKYMTIPGRK